MDEFARDAVIEWQAKRAARQRVFWLHALVWVSVNLLLVVVWAATGAGFPWFLFPLFGWLVGLVAHGAVAYVLRDHRDIMVTREVAAQPSDEQAAGS